MTAGESSWVVSLILFGCLAASVPAAWLADKWGRKPVLLATGPLFLASFALVLATRSVQVLYAVRLLQGLGMGTVYTVLPNYLGEIAAPRIRASMGYFFPMVWYLGSLYDYTTGPYVTYQTFAWIMIAPPIVFLLTFIWFPESPYYYLTKGREDEAQRSLAWLRRGQSVEEVKNEFEAMKCSVTEEIADKVSWKDLLTTPAGRKSMAILLAMDAAYVMTGGTAMLSYSTDTFTKIGGGPILPHDFTILMCVLLLVLVPFSGVAVDRLGRRPMLMASTVGAALFLSLTSLFVYLYQRTSLDLSTYGWVPQATIVLSMLFIGTGVESIVFVLQAELFPNNSRDAASGLAFLATSLMSSFCLKMYQVLDDGVGLDFLYGFFAFWAYLAAVFVFFAVPETKGKTFAEIQAMLNKKETEHVTPL